MNERIKVAPRRNRSAERSEASEPVEAPVVSEDTTEEETAPPAPSGQFIKYVGKATERVIESGTWPAGVDQDLSVTWGFMNDFKVPVSSFGEDHVAFLLGEDETDFALVD